MLCQLMLHAGQMSPGNVSVSNILTVSQVTPCLNLIQNWSQVLSGDILTDILHYVSFVSKIS